MRTRTLATSLLGLTALPLVASAAVTGAAAAPAAGEPVVYEDATGDVTDAVDMTDVTTLLVGRTDGRLRIKVESAEEQSSGDYTAIFFDTKRSNPGPELRLSAARDSEYTLFRVDGFVDFNGELVQNCDFYSFRQARNGSFMAATIDLDCLGDPSKVRFEVSTEAANNPENVDWLGSTKRFHAYQVR